MALPAQLAGTVLLPPIHVHSLVVGLNSQRSFRSPPFWFASNPAPPKSQKLPLLSLPYDVRYRPPGMFAAAAEPRDP